MTAGSITSSASSDPSPTASRSGSATSRPMTAATHNQETPHGESRGSCAAITIATEIAG